MKRDVLLNELAAMVLAIHQDHPLRVGVDGVDGAGKTTFADELAGVLRKRGKRVIRASLDGFHNPVSIRYRQGPLSARGYFLDSFNYKALRDNLLEPLGPNGSRDYRARVFDHQADSELRAPNERAEIGDVLVFDGVFLQRDELRGCWDFVVWLEADFELTVSRAVARDLSRPPGNADPSALAERYARRYVPGQKMYVEECHPREKAHVVVRNGDWANPEMERGSSRRTGLTSAGRPFILISGLPGSGKTTLGRRLAPALNLPLIDKDDILDRLFETKGVSDAAWRRTLSRESDALLQREATSTSGAVLVSFWWLPGMPVDSGTPSNWITALSSRVVNVHCVCEPDLAAERFLRRTRHPGHLDRETSYADVLAGFRELNRLGPIGVGQRVEVDTSLDLELDAVVRDVRRALARCLQNL